MNKEKFLKRLAWNLSQAGYKDTAADIYKLIDLHKKSAEDDLEEGGEYEKGRLNKDVPLETLYKCLLFDYKKLVEENELLLSEKGIKVYRDDNRRIIKKAKKIQAENKRLAGLLEIAHNAIRKQAEEIRALKAQAEE